MSDIVMPDDIARWIDDCVDASDRQAFTTTRPLYTCWKNWSHARGMSPTSEKRFVSALGVHFEHKRVNYGRGFKGLRLRTTPTITCQVEAVADEPGVSPIALGAELHPPDVVPEAAAPPDYEVLGPAPARRCCVCAQCGDVLLIKYKANTYMWHERCAAHVLAVIRRS